MPNTMIFQDYGTNPFVATAQDNLSTFAIDVDTGSYTVARRYVNDGLLPPPEAVRIEEFVNYFDYDYSYPTKEELFAIYMDAAPVPFASHSSGAAEMVRIGIQGYDVAPAERADLALTFVIDVSGSMGNENRLTLVKRSLTLLVEELRPTDSVGIVAYSTTAREVLPPTQASQKNRILDAIFALQPENSTNAAAGLRLGYTMAWNHFQPRSINRVILASDGVANVDVTNAADIWEQIKQYAARGITLTTIGVGMGNYNDVLMEQLADTGDGFYAYVDTIEEAEQLFVHDLTGTLQTIAKDAKIQVEFDPEVVSHYRLLGYENREVADVDFRNDAVDAGEVGAGHSVTALYEIRRYPNAIGRIATTHLRWQDPASHQIFEMTETLDSRAIAASFENAPLNFQLAVAVAEYAQSLRNSMAIDGRPSHRSLSSVLLVEAIRIGEALNNKANRSHAADQTGGEIDDVTEWVNLIQKTHAIMRNMATTSARAPISRDAFEYPLPTSADAFSVALPPAWSNKILFLSDRTGRTETWMMDPAANFRISQVSESWIHALAQEQRAFAPDGRAKLLTRTDANGGLQIHIHDFASNAIRPLTVLRGANHDPVWSPRGDWIYFVSSASGVDEIMRTNRAGNLFERLTVSDMSDHPSVSPDGQSIIFHSTRETGRQQLWIMNADGSNLRNLSNSSRNDWDPVWTR
ncbi:von Willebrand factor type A domain-containing protein [Chloroflexi bacterium TSY]|nr:von Willebrand factor type A domain-containing protein [Chloroflexi bacterium TSY]